MATAIDKLNEATQPKVAEIAPEKIAPAAQRVFDIPELLENILINLPYDNLYVLQRVNPTFRGVMAGSKKLRKIMFLEPFSSPDRLEKNSAMLADAHPLHEQKIMQAVSPWKLSFGGVWTMRTAEDEKLLILHLSTTLELQYLSPWNRKERFRGSLPSKEENFTPSWRKIRIDCIGYETSVNVAREELIKTEKMRSWPFVMHGCVLLGKLIDKASDIYLERPCQLMR